MPNIKEVVDRISSVTSTQQITKAMKMVAAAKLNKVQQQVLQMRPYAEKLASILENVTAGTAPKFVQAYLEKRPVKQLLLVVMTSDRGLCGSFNANILKKALSYLQNVTSDTHVTVLPIGQKALNFFQKREFNMVTSYATLFHHLDFEHASQVATFLSEGFLTHNYDQVLLVYNRLQNAATQIPMVEELLPIAQSTSEEAPKAQSDYIYGPSKKVLTQTLVPQVLQMQFYKALLESSASEHSARVTTMGKATDNADELLKTLRLTYNRTRQAVITREISEIVAGTDALAS